MGLPKGRTNNLKGRPLGAVNKDTAELRNRINAFLSEKWEIVVDDWESMEPKERLRFYEKMLQYKLPHLQRTELTNDIEKMTDEQLDYIINDLKECINDQGTKN